jgi:hypothetical protein
MFVSFDGFKSCEKLPCFFDVLLLAEDLDQQLAAEVSEHSRSLKLKVWQKSNMQVDSSAISNLRVGDG